MFSPQLWSRQSYFSPLHRNIEHASPAHETCCPYRPCQNEATALCNRAQPRTGSGHMQPVPNAGGASGNVMAKSRARHAMDTVIPAFITSLPIPRFLQTTQMAALKAAAAATSLTQPLAAPWPMTAFRLYTHHAHHAHHRPSRRRRRSLAQQKSLSASKRADTSTPTAPLLYLILSALVSVPRCRHAFTPLPGIWALDQSENGPSIPPYQAS